MSGGWGKRAASRIDRTQFEQDELLKSLGTQFNVDFAGYDQWQRRTKGSQSVQKPHTVRDDSSFIVGRIKSAECQHSTFREKKQAAKLEEINKARSERLKVLELRLQTRRRTLEEYQRRYKELLDENLQLKTTVTKGEKASNDTVKGLLRKYEKYRGGMTTLSTNYEKELKGAVESLRQTEKKLSSSLSSLQSQLDEVEKSLEEHQNHLHVLNSYKDKEYPVKAMKISNLQTSMDTLKVSNQEDQEELQHIINTEIGKYQKKKVQVSNEITFNMTEKAIDMMHPSLKDMALQNMVMEKEVEFHSKEQVQLQDAIAELEEEIKQMIRDPKTNTRLQMFPEFYPTRVKCHPDMDVVLDIPTQDWLPI